MSSPRGKIDVSITYPNNEREVTHNGQCDYSNGSDGASW